MSEGHCSGNNFEAMARAEFVAFTTNYQEMLV